MDAVKVVLVFGCGMVVGSIATSKLLGHKPVEVVYAVKAKLPKLPDKVDVKLHYDDNDQEEFLDGEEA